MTTLCGMEIHPAAERDPLLEGDEKQRLKDSLKRNGQRDPITIDQFERVVDGRNRLVCLAELGIEPVFEPMQFATDADAYAYNDDKNEHRRHLTAAQRARRAASVAVVPRGRPETKASREAFSSEETPAGQTAVTEREAAAAQGVSRSSVQRVKRVEAKGTPELQQAVEAEQISLKRAAEIANLPPEQQVAEVEAAKAPKPKKKDSKVDTATAKPAVDEDTSEAAEPPAVEVRGVGVRRAHEAIACLKRIPQNDALRDRAYEIVLDYITHNRKE